MLTRTPITSHRDERGALLKLSPAPVRGEVYLVTLEPGVVRGQHRHDRMGERFIALRGEGVLGYLTDAGAPAYMPLVPGWCLEVPAGVGHALFNTGVERLDVLALAERLHDPEDVHPVDIPWPAGDQP